MPVDLSAFQVAPGEKPASSSKQNNLITSVQAALNAMPASSVVGYPADAAKYLNGAGGWTTPISDMAAIYIKSGTTDVTATSLTDLFAGAITIAAGKMSATGAIKIWCGGDYLTSATRKLNLALVLGSQTLWESGLSNDIVSGADRRAWSFWCVIQALTTSSQVGSGQFGLNDSNAATTGTGVIHASGAGIYQAPFITIGGTVNMTGSQGLALKAAHSGASASIRCNYARVEVTT